MATPTVITPITSITPAPSIDRGVGTSQRCEEELSHLSSLAEDDQWHCRLPVSHDGLSSSRRDDVANSRLVPGITRTLTYQVHPQDLVTTLFPGSPEFARKPPVLATGILVALCEWPAMDALRQVIGDDEDSLGTDVCLSHHAPVCVGTQLTVTARCTSVTGRVSRWDVCAHDGTRTVASGWVQFAVVHTPAFLQRHSIKPASVSAFHNLRHPPNQNYAPNDHDRAITCTTRRLHPMGGTNKT
ncbi:MAG: thioesterase family protein [Pseudonocardiaceae bacterium]